MSSQLDSIFYVYLHRRITDGSIFYVGKGKGTRDSSKSGRSNHWRNIVKKNGYYIERVKDGITECEAYELEINLIRRLREDRKNICNIANGGEGGLFGIKLKDDHKEKLRNAKLGKKQMPEHAKKSAMAKTGKKQPRSAVETIRKLNSVAVINSNGDIFPSASEASRAMSMQNGINASQGNISMCARGERSIAYGVTWSYDITKTPELRTPHDGKKKIYCSNGLAFNSVGDALSFVKTIRGTAFHQPISKAARTGGRAYGYKWTYNQPDDIAP